MPLPNHSPKRLSWILTLVLLFGGQDLICADGELDDFAPVFSRDENYDPAYIPSVSAIAFQPNGALWLGGEFDFVDDSSTSRVVGFDHDGAIFWTTPSYRVPKRTNNLVSTPQGDLLIAGPTQNFGDRILIRLNFNGETSGFPGLLFGGEIFATALLSDGKILVGGTVSEARIGHPPPWSTEPPLRKYLLRLNSDDTIDESFRFQLDEVVRCIAIDPFGETYVGGDFGLVRVSNSGEVIDSPVEVNGEVHSLIFDAERNLLVGGLFEEIAEERAGTTTLHPIRNLARIAPSLLSVDVSFHPDPDGVVNTIAVQGDGRVLIGGEFVALGRSEPVSRGRLAKILPDGGVDPSFQTSANATVHAVALQADGNILVGGEFSEITAATTEAREHFAKLNNGTGAHTLTIHDATRVTFETSGCYPESSRVLFDHSSDGGNTWSLLAEGEPIDGVWTARWLALPFEGLVRARAFVNGGRASSSVSLHTVSESYNGFLAPDIEIEHEGVPLPYLTWSAFPQRPAISYGPLKPGEPASIEIAVSNRGSTELTGLLATVDGPDADSFTLDSALGATLAPGESATILVTLTPGADFDFSGGNTLMIASNDPDESDFHIRFTGIRDLWADRQFQLPPPPPPGSEPNSGDIVVATRIGTGRFGGIISQEDESGAHQVIGAIKNLTITELDTTSPPSREFIGTLCWKNRSVPFQTILGLNDPVEFSVTVPTGPTVTFQLASRPTSGAYLTGEATWENGTAGVYLPETSYDAISNPVPEEQVGRYTFAIPNNAPTRTDAPNGDGWGVVTLDSDGSIRIEGSLPDGSRFSDSAWLSDRSDFTLYSSLYNQWPESGYVVGRIVFRDLSGISDFDGILKWVRPANPRASAYREGLNWQRQMIGCRYVEPAAGTRVLAEVANATFNAEICFTHPTILRQQVGYLDCILNWDETNLLLSYGPGKFRGVIDPTSGILEGHFRPPSLGRLLRFEGVAFQKQGLTAGLFRTGGQTGGVRILPGGEFPFPANAPFGPPPNIEAPASEPVTPSFEVLPEFESAAAGTYSGLLRSENDPIGSLEGVRVTRFGVLSGRLRLDGRVFRFRGRLDPATSEVNISLERPAPLSPLQLVLRLVTDGTDYRLEGTLTDDEVTHSIDAVRRPLPATEPAPWQPGRYTLVTVPPDDTDASLAPTGNGCGAFRITPRGACLGLLHLPDGTRTPIRGFLTKNSEWQFFRPLYQRRLGGFLAGQFQARDEEGISDLDGNLRWFRPPNALRNSPTYPGGFDQLLDVVASHYAPAPPGTCTFSELTDGDHNAWLRITGPDDLELDHTVTWNRFDRIRYYGPETIVVRFQRSNGILRGRYYDPEIGSRFPFTGVLLKKQGLAAGFRLSGRESHPVLLSPRGTQ